MHKFANRKPSVHYVCCKTCCYVSSEKHNHIPIVTFTQMEAECRICQTFHPICCYLHDVACNLFLLASLFCIRFKNECILISFELFFRYNLVYTAAILFKHSYKKFGVCSFIIFYLFQYIFVLQYSNINTYKFTTDRLSLYNIVFLTFTKFELKMVD